MRTFNKFIKASHFIGGGAVIIFGILYLINENSEELSIVVIVFGIIMIINAIITTKRDLINKRERERINKKKLQKREPR